VTADAGLALDRVSAVRGGRRVLHELTVRLPTGGWLALIGPNGAGKSTALLAAAGLLPHDGEVAVDGVDRRRLAGSALARRLAYVAQEPALPPDMAVLDYVLLGRRPHLPYLGRESARDLAVVAEVLDRLDLTGLAAAGRRLGALSGGERQRVVLGRALAQQPRVMLLDEPTSALDLGRQQRALELLDALRREDGLTVVTAVHDLTLAGQFADRLVLLADGRTVASGAPADVLREQTLAAAYGARVRVLPQPDGTLAVLPVRGRDAPDAA
jgi:iron complex transport system ATP-binding protein